MNVVQPIQPVLSMDDSEAGQEAVWMEEVIARDTPSNSPSKEAQQQQESAAETQKQPKQQKTKRPFRGLLQRLKSRKAVPQSTTTSTTLKQEENVSKNDNAPRIVLVEETEEERQQKDAKRQAKIMQREQEAKARQAEVPNKPPPILRKPKATRTEADNIRSSDFSTRFLTQFQDFTQSSSSSYTSSMFAPLKTQENKPKPKKREKPKLTTTNQMEPREEQSSSVWNIFKSLYISDDDEDQTTSLASTNNYNRSSNEEETTTTMTGRNNSSKRSRRRRNQNRRKDDYSAASSDNETSFYSADNTYSSFDIDDYDEDRSTGTDDDDYDDSTVEESTRGDFSMAKRDNIRKVVERGQAPEDQKLRLDPISTLGFDSIMDKDVNNEILSVSSLNEILGSPDGTTKDQSQITFEAANAGTANVKRESSVIVETVYSSSANESTTSVAANETNMADSFVAKGTRTATAAVDTNTPVSMTETNNEKTIVSPTASSTTSKSRMSNMKGRMKTLGRLFKKKKKDTPTSETEDKVDDDDKDPGDETPDPSVANVIPQDNDDQFDHDNTERNRLRSVEEKTSRRLRSADDSTLTSWNAPSSQRVSYEASSVVVAKTSDSGKPQMVEVEPIDPTDLTPGSWMSLLNGASLGDVKDAGSRSKGSIALSETSRNAQYEIPGRPSSPFSRSSKFPLDVSSVDGFSGSRLDTTASASTTPAGAQYPPSPKSKFNSSLDKYKTDDQQTPMSQLQHTLSEDSQLPVEAGDRYTIANDDTDSVHIDAVHRLEDPKPFVTDVEVMLRSKPGHINGVRRVMSEDMGEEFDAPAGIFLEVADQTLVNREEFNKALSAPRAKEFSAIPVVRCGTNLGVQPSDSWLDEVERVREEKRVQSELEELDRLERERVEREKARKEGEDKENELSSTMSGQDGGNLSELVEVSQSDHADAGSVDGSITSGISKISAGEGSNKELASPSRKQRKIRSFFGKMRKKTADTDPPGGAVVLSPVRKKLKGFVGRRTRRRSQDEELPAKTSLNPVEEGDEIEESDSPIDTVASESSSKSQAHGDAAASVEVGTDLEVVTVSESTCLSGGQP